MQPFDARVGEGIAVYERDLLEGSHAHDSIHALQKERSLNSSANQWEAVYFW